MKEPYTAKTKEQLLETPIYKLGLRIKGSEIEPCISRLYNELSQKGLSFMPVCYLTDEWGCPDRIPVIGIPFYLAHPVLKKLEREMMLEAEGDTETGFMKLLRHETGHAYNYAYRLYNRTRWRRLFGPFSLKYSTNYRPRPYSRKYVRHLDNWYAQCHPDEDFAETFAVWLTPGSGWRERYCGWGAIKKLEYVNKLMADISYSPPLVTAQNIERPASGIRMKLGTYYKRKRRKYAHEYPDFYDEDLKEIFPECRPAKNTQSASSFLKEHREDILDIISFWTAENKYTINQLLKDLIIRCSELNLTAARRRKSTYMLNISSFLTTLLMNYYYTGEFVPYEKD